jgi:glycine/D-amino acid oxidase-like deaminating enzyme
MRVCVLGGGVSGSFSALSVKAALPAAHVDVVAEAFSPETTSDGVAGFCQPHLDPDTSTENVM